VPYLMTAEPILICQLMLYISRLVNRCMNFILHKFRSGETIDAVIRLKGRHSYSHEEILALRKRFNELNGLIVPRPGQIFKIPLEGIGTDDFGNSVFLVPVDGPVVSDPKADGNDPANG